jgi:hypothetical protein
MTSNALPPQRLPGLLNVSGIVAGDEVTDSLDAQVDLIAQLQADNSSPSHIVVNPLECCESSSAPPTPTGPLLGAGTSEVQQLAAEPAGDRRG